MVQNGRTFIIVHDHYLIERNRQIQLPNLLNNSWIITKQNIIASNENKEPLQLIQLWMIYTDWEKPVYPHNIFKQNHFKLQLSNNTIRDKSIIIVFTLSRLKLPNTVILSINCKYMHRHMFGYRYRYKCRPRCRYGSIGIDIDVGIGIGLAYFYGKHRSDNELWRHADLNTEVNPNVMFNTTLRI